MSSLVSSTQAPTNGSNLPLLLLAVALVSSFKQGNALSSSSISTPSKLMKIGTRPSNLALIQAKKFEAALLDLIETVHTDDMFRGIQTEIVPIDASGDKKGQNAGTQDLPLAMKAVDFTGSLDDALMDGRIDVAVHSLKDIPPANRWREGLVIGGHLGPRADPHDVLVGPYSTFEDLPEGARVGSASIRRQAQLLSHRPDITVVNIRGNVQARLAALESGDIDALILAAAGMDRLGLSEENNIECHRVDIDDMLPGAAQGIIAIVCRADDDKALSLLQCIDDREARIAATAERSLLDIVDGVRHQWPGRPPVAAYMSRDDEGWTLRGLLATPDGSKVVRTLHKAPHNCDNEGAFELGRRAGQDILGKAGGPNFLKGYG